MSSKKLGGAFDVGTLGAPPPGQSQDNNDDAVASQRDSVKKGKPDVAMVHTSLYLDRALLGRLKRYAFEREKTVNALLVEQIEEWCD